MPAAALRLSTIAVAMLLASTGTPRADDQAERQQAVVELLRVTRTMETIESSLDDLAEQLAPAVIARIRQRDPSVSDAALRPVVEKMLTIFAEEYEREMPGIVAKVSAFTADNYTLDEIREMTAFYSSPLGQKTLDLMPGLSRVMGREMGEMAMRVNQRALVRLEKMIDEIARSRGEEDG